MGSAANVEAHGGPNETATLIAPGTPIGNASPGTGAFTTLLATTSFSSTGDWGVQARLGRTGQAGRLDFLRGNDGGVTASIGYSSATEGAVLDVSNLSGGGTFRVTLNRSASGTGEIARFSSLNDGSFSIGVSAPSSRFHLIAGQAAAGRSPQKFTTGPLLTTPEAGAEEFSTNDRFYTGTDGVRRQYAARLSSTTVAGLPAGVQGDQAYVTDALTPAWNAAVVGGGTVFIKVLRNATAWVCG